MKKPENQRILRRFQTWKPSFSGSIHQTSSGLLVRPLVISTDGNSKKPLKKLRFGTFGLEK